jgi:hypothetical protein
LLGRHAFDRGHVVEHDHFFAIARQAQGAGDFLRRPKMEKLYESARDANVFRDREKVEPRKSQNSEGIGHLIEKARNRDRNLSPKRRSNQIENLMMARTPGMNAQLEIVAKLLDLGGPERLKLV